MAELPKTLTQVAARFAENLASAFSQLAHDLHGVDPMLAELPTEDAAPQPPEVGTAKSAPAPHLGTRSYVVRPRMTTAEWRMWLIEEGLTVFTMDDVAERLIPGFREMPRSTRWGIRVYLQERVTKVGEVQEHVAAKPGRGGHPAVFRFDPAQGRPKLEFRRDKPAGAKRLVHPGREGKHKPHSPNKEVRKLIDAAWDQGWLVIQTKNSHLAFTTPKSDETIYAASTPSDHRAVKNMAAMLKTAGLKT